MKFNVLGLHSLGVAAAALLTGSGHLADNVVITEKDRVLARAKASDLGRMGVAAIAAAEDPALSGPQKFERALESFAPELLKVAVTGDPDIVASDVESLGRELLQSIFTDTKSTSAGKAVSALTTAFRL